MGWGRDYNVLRKLSSVHLLHAFKLRLLARTYLSEHCFQALNSSSLSLFFFIHMVSQHSWYSGGWCDMTDGSKKQQTDYCSLRLICQIKELSTVPLHRNTANKTAKDLRVNKSSTISDMSQNTESKHFWCCQPKLNKKKCSNASSQGVGIELILIATPPLLPISHLAVKSLYRNSFAPRWMTRWLHLHLRLKALFTLCPRHDSDTRFHRGIRSSPASMRSSSFVNLSQCSLLPKAHSGHSASRLCSLLNLSGVIKAVTHSFFLFFSCYPLNSAEKHCFHISSTLTFASSCLWKENNLLDLSLLKLCHFWFHSVWRANI